MIKRMEKVEVATSDLDDAAKVYEKNFGFTVRRTAGSDEASIAIGDSEIRLHSGSPVAEFIAKSGEGLAALWLEADDVDEVAKALSRAGLTLAPIRVEAGRRILAVDPKSANMVPLYIFDHRP